MHVLRQSLNLVLTTLHVLVAAASATLKSRATLHLENLALRHQLGVLHRSVKRPKLAPPDRLLWAWLCAVWKDWRSALVIVNPDTVIAWHRKSFRLFWTWKVRRGQPGRPGVPKNVRELIRKLSRENPLWGAPRIHGELLKLGIDIGETSVGKYLAPPKAAVANLADLPRESRQDNGLGGLFHGPDHPLPGAVRLSGSGVIGPIRRECLDHVIVFGEAALYQHVKRFMHYYHESRTHLSLAKDAPEPRLVNPPILGPVVAIPQVGGLHHRYERQAA